MLLHFNPGKNSGIRLAPSSLLHVGHPELVGVPRSAKLSAGCVRVLLSYPVLVS